MVLFEANSIDLNVIMNDINENYTDIEPKSDGSFK